MLSGLLKYPRSIALAGRRVRYEATGAARAPGHDTGPASAAAGLSSRETCAAGQRARSVSWGVLRQALQQWSMALLLAATAGLCAAKEAQPLAEDPVLEARVMAIAEELRCLVCQNETIAASHAELAVDLRKQIRQKLQQGQSQQQIIDFMVQRYGDFVLYRPPVKRSTWLLWGGPFVLLGIALVALVMNIRRRRTAAPPPLRPDEAERVRRLLADERKPS
jgi:cytochrome c-type biogenesis protein CcmH